MSPATQIEILPLVYIEIVFAKLEKTKYVFARRSIVEIYQFLEHKTFSQKSYGRNREPKHSRALHAIKRATKTREPWFSSLIQASSGRLDQPCRETSLEGDLQQRKKDAFARFLGYVLKHAARFGTYAFQIFRKQLVLCTSSGHSTFWSNTALKKSIRRLHNVTKRHLESGAGSWSKQLPNWIW